MKKMRRLIPAIAMLLVSAVMLSTASFAWFTMNTEVTTKGMQIQAKADSSLVISDAPLQFDTGKDTVDFQSTANTLKPMTWGSYVNNADQTVNGWVVPSNYSSINPLSGIKDTATTWVYANPTEGNGGQYIEKEVYIASAGALIQQATITVTLTAPVSSLGSAVKAYAAALYVVPATVDGEKNTAWEDNETISKDATPDMIVYVDTAKDTTYTNGRNVVTLPGKYDIPSILGVGEQDEATTGLKVIIRFFVDGDLASVGDDKVTVTTGYKYEKATGKYVAGTQYYVAAADTYKYNVVSAPVVENISSYYVLVDGEYVEASGTSLADDTVYYTREVIKNYNQAIIPEGMTTDTDVLATWFVRNAITESVNYKYIRTDDVPGTGSELEIAFSTVAP